MTQDQNDVISYAMQRRRYLQAMAVGSIGAVAGCSGTSNGSGDSDGGDGETGTGDNGDGETGTGDNGSDGTGTAGSGQANIDELSFLTWNQGFFSDSLEEIKSDYKERHGYEDTEVNWLDKNGPDLIPFLNTRLQGGNAPEQLMLMGPSIHQFIPDEVIVPLDDFLPDDFINKFSHLDKAKVDGELYSLPFQWAFQTIFYRKKFFEEAGVDPPTLDSPYTLTQLLDTIRDVVDNSSAEFGFSMLRFNYYITNLFVADGVDLLNNDKAEAAFNTSRTHEILERLKTLTDEGYIPRLTWTERWEQPLQQFGSGNTAMFMGENPATWMIESNGDWVNEDTMGIAGTLNNSSPLLPMNMCVTGANKSQAEMQAGADLLQTILSAKWQKEYLSGVSTTVGNTEALGELANSEEYQNNHPLWVKGIEVGEQQIPKGWLPPKIPSSFTVMETINSEFSGAALGQKPIDQAVSSAEQKINQALSGN
jgi:ABC-type glycerol-3-phosphate transport system substrate-binding protein